MQSPTKTPPDAIPEGREVDTRKVVSALARVAQATSDAIRKLADGDIDGGLDAMESMNRGLARVERAMNGPCPDPGVKH